MDVLASLAALLKLPSRVTTYIELFWGSTNKARPHLAPVAKAWAETRAVEGASFRVATCGGAKNATAPIEEPCFSARSSASRWKNSKIQKLFKNAKKGVENG